MRYLDDRAGELTLDVCGADRQERRYARLVPAGVRRAVRFRGRVPDDEMPELYRRADVFCAPSLGHETSGVALLEAMATGAAVVASRLPGYDEVVDDGVDGLLVPPRKPRVLAAALRRLLDEPGLREPAGARGLRACTALRLGARRRRDRGRLRRGRRRGGGSRSRAAAASSASSSPTSTSTRTTARTA